MTITARIDKLITDEQTAGNVKAFASARLDNDFVVHGIMVCTSGADGELTVQMPWRPVGNRITDTFHALNHNSRRQLATAVIDEYERAVQKYDN